MTFKAKIKANASINSLYRKLKYGYYKYLMSDKRHVQSVFKKRYNYDLNLNNPKTFTEKINYLKLYYANDEKAILAGDKIGLHAFLKQKQLANLAVPMVALADSVKDIQWTELPNQFVIKKSNASKMNLIVRDLAQLSVDELKQILKKWEKQVFGLATAEPHYEKMQSRFIIEKYIPNIERDWKIFFCNGEPCMLEAYLWEKQEKLVGHRKTVYITADLNGKVLQIDADEQMAQPIQTSGLKFIDLPPQFEQMIDYGRILAEDFPFVRVDFFVSDGQLFLGELTFTPAAGLDNYSEEIEQWLGEKISLPHEKRRAAGSSIQRS
ncbi:ATP-grasp fold amidoligase family protein [Enterococcus xiangfangensis]